jgi:hypothetical protein
VITSSSAISCGATSSYSRRDIITDLGMRIFNQKYILEFNVTPSKNDVYNYVLSICNEKTMLSLNKMANKITIDSYEFDNNNINITLVSYDDQLNINSQQDFQFPLQIKISEETQNKFTQWINDNNKLDMMTVNAWYNADDETALNKNMNLFFDNAIIDFVKENNSSFFNFINTFDLDIKFEPYSFHLYDESGISVNSFLNNFINKKIKIVFFECTEFNLSIGSSEHNSWVDTSITTGSKPEKVNLDVARLNDADASQIVDIDANFFATDSKVNAVKRFFNTAIYNFYLKYLGHSDSSDFVLTNTHDWWKELNSTISLEYENQTIPLKWDQSDNDCFDNFIDFVNQHNNPVEDIVNIENVKLIITVGDNEWFTGTLEINCNLNISHL